MSTDAEALNRIDHVFGSWPRPTQFTVADGDPECMEYDVIFHKHTPENLPIKNFRNTGYCPLSELFTDGFAYFFPAFTRFVLSDESSELTWHGEVLFGYLHPYQPFFEFCTSTQKQAVAYLLEHLMKTRAELAEKNFCFEDLVKVSAAWAEAAEVFPSSST